MIGDIRFCGCGWMPIRGSLCLFWYKTHTKGLRTRFPARPEENEGKPDPRAVNRSQGKVTVRERQLLSEELGPVDPEARLADVRGWVSIPCGCVGILLGYMLVIAHRCTEKCPNFSLLVLGANPSLCLFVLLFFHPLSCVLCVCKAMWNAPGQRWEKPLDDRMAMSWFRRLS